MYTIYIGNKNYSSWSLRGWLAAKMTGVEVREVLIQLTGTYNAANRAFSPTALVPSLHDGDIMVWDTMAIAEYVAERHAGLWPTDAPARAWARSIAAEMHSGFAAVRNDMTMCIRERLDVRPWSDALKTQLARIEEIWTESRRRYGHLGPYLCGPFTLADAFYAPVAFRFQTYGVEPAGVAGDYWRALLAHPLLREWETAALAETEIIDADEPRVLYRDKLRANGIK